MKAMSTIFANTYINKLKNTKVGQHLREQHDKELDDIESYFITEN